jgi:hypothetical protein
LYLAREDEPERHRGTVLRIHESVFAPSEGSLRFVRPGAFNVDVWRLSYTRHLRELWRSDPEGDPEAFLGLIELASGGGDVTLVDDFGDADYAPRRILGAALKQIARSRRDEALRKARRAAGATSPVASPAGGPRPAGDEVRRFANGAIVASGRSEAALAGALEEGLALPAARVRVGFRMSSPGDPAGLRAGWHEVGRYDRLAPARVLAALRAHPGDLQAFARDVLGMEPSVGNLPGDAPDVSAGVTLTIHPVGPGGESPGRETGAP